jgi:hypothetical protein
MWFAVDRTYQAVVMEMGMVVMVMVIEEEGLLG